MFCLQHSCKGLVGVLVVLMLSVCWWQYVAGQDYQYWDDQGVGVHIDQLSRKGIQLLLRWRSKFLGRINSANSRLSQAVTLLDGAYSDSNLFNLTAYAIQKLQPVNAKLDAAAALLANLNTSANTGDGMIAFFKGSLVTINVGGAYNPSNRASGTFTVPQRGLYRVMVRTYQGTNIAVDIMRNGNVTLSWLQAANYYDVKTRIRLVWLNPGDEIFCTGSIPKYFGVWLLQKQTLTPRFV